MTMTNLILALFSAITFAACSFGGVADQLKAQEDRCNSMTGTYSGSITTPPGNQLASELYIACRPTSNGTDPQGKTRVLNVMEAQVRIYDIVPQDLRLSVSDDLSGKLTFMPIKKPTTDGQVAADSDNAFSFGGFGDSNSISGTILRGVETYGHATYSKSSSDYSSLSSDRWDNYLKCAEDNLNSYAGEYNGSFTTPAGETRNVMLRISVEKVGVYPTLSAYYTWTEPAPSIAPKAEPVIIPTSERFMTVTLDTNGNRTKFTLKTVATTDPRLKLTIDGIIDKGVISSENGKANHLDARGINSLFTARKK